jgi:hypothetical protein
MGQNGIVLILELFGLFKPFLHDFTERHTRLHQFRIILNFIVGTVVELALIIVGATGSTEQGARDVGRIPKGTNYIGVQCHQLSRAKNMGRSLLQPGIGAVSGCEQTPFDSVAASLDIGLSQMRPKLDPGDTGT